MSQLPSPSSLVSPESVPSTMCHMSSQVEWDEEVDSWSVDIGKEEEVSNESVMKDCVDGKEVNGDFEERVEELKTGMEFDTHDEAYLYYTRFAKEKGFAVAKRSSKKGKDGMLKHVILQCSRGGKPRLRGSNPAKARPQCKVECPAHLNVIRTKEGNWRVSQVLLEHNHEQSPSKSRFFKSNRALDENVRMKLLLNEQAGIRLNKTVASLHIEAGGPDKVPYFPRDCRNYLDKLRRLQLAEGDAEAMHRYFMRMRGDNANFFYAMDLNEKGRLRNVFWADARSRAACKEFGDVVTFDTTYLVNKYDMPFAPFVGVNHHGQSILLGCGLIFHEDTESFSWLFKTWLECMWGSAPKAILTDQCQAMRNAIQNIFPDTRHRWCIWHIMKKVPEKLSGYEAYQRISYYFRQVVYDSLTKEEFEMAWDVFMKKYDLTSNTWLHGLYLEKERWVPAYVKDMFWAGMSSTQRSESMNAYFNGYIYSKTTLKQFVEQYENALTQKVEIEKLSDMQSWYSFISCMTNDDLEKQFQSAYTNDKFAHFRDEFLGKMACSLGGFQVGHVWTEYEVKESITIGEGEEVQ
ncbi:protein FAR-RED IMPAIRED RESPONSE 1-like [Actinidia eriantha]|uniref:protein FAR-RED IMPAIRED RESPONSE 1-like n=1 Tax=Actinidia eriantha TaxID=165200 RepID=UPI002587BB24|nr:protein FAR-RED IMPAIRED RESPONSE 1-like [Actinidia eriantha]